MKEQNLRRIQNDVEMLHRVLRQKEVEFQRVQNEIAALHSIMPLLAEDTTELDLSTNQANQS